MRPTIGRPTLLVYRECPCGDWCATGEGALAPICPECDGRYLPPSDNRENRGLGFIAMLTAEQGAAWLLNRIQRLFGLYRFDGERFQHTLASALDFERNGPRYFGEGEIRAMSDSIKAGG